MKLNIKNMSRKWLIISLIVTALIVCLLMAFAVNALIDANRINLVRNEDFSSFSDGKPSKWEVYNWKEEINPGNSSAKYYIDDKTTFKGHPTLCLEVNEENDVRFYQTIKVKPSTYYEITYCLRIDGEIESGYGAGLSLFDSKNIYPSTGEISNWTTDNAWQEFYIYGVTDKDQTSLQLAIGLGCFDDYSSGKIWIGDVMMKQIDPGDIEEGKEAQPLYSPNLVYNGNLSIENSGVPHGWELYDWKNDSEYQDTGVNFYNDKDEPVRGHASLFVEVPEENDVRFYQTITVEPNTHYEITAYFKIDGELDGGYGAGLSLYDQKTTFYNAHDTTTENEWVQYVIYGITDADQTSLQLAVGIGGFSATSSGKAWIGDVSMIRIDEDNIPEDANVFDLFASKNSNEEVHKLMLSETANKIIFVVCLFAIFTFVIILAVKSVKKNKGREDLIKEGQWQPGMKLVNRSEILLMTVITVAYLLLALYNLGSSVSPETNFKPTRENTGESVIVSFDEKQDITRVMYHTVLAGVNEREDWYGGILSYKIEYFDEEADEYLLLMDIKHFEFYKWYSNDVNVSTDKLKITATQPVHYISEIGFLKSPSDGVNEEFEIISPVKVMEVIPATGAENSSEISDYEEWFDEQDTIVFTQNYMNSTYFDEVYFPRTAYEHMNGLKVYETTHPPLGKVIQAVGMSVFGTNPFGWRIMGTLFGAAMIPLMFLLAKKMFNNTFFAFLASALMLFDTMHFAQTRLATIDSYPLVFIMLMYYFMYDIFMCKSYEVKFNKHVLSLGLCGLCFGLGASSKWIGFYAAFGLAILLFLSKGMEIYDYKKLAVATPEVKEEKWYKNYYLNNIFLVALLCFAFFIIVPVIIYCLSYIPYVSAEGENGNLFQIIIRNQKEMFNYHSGLLAPHGSSSEWWQWILDLKPFWYYRGTSSNGFISTIVSFGNPVVWWSGIIALFSGCYIGMKKADKRVIFILVGFASQLLPWMLIFRASFIYHYFSCLPFLILFIVYVIKHLYDTRVIQKWMIIAFLVVVALTFFIFYPVISGMPISESLKDYLKILPLWNF